MKYDSVLDQQSISGKIVSLILYVWKPCYVKSGHICIVYTVPMYSPEHIKQIKELSGYLYFTYAPLEEGSNFIFEKI